MELLDLYHELHRELLDFHCLWWISLFKTDKIKLSNNIAQIVSHSLLN